MISIGKRALVVILGFALIAQGCATIGRQPAAKLTGRPLEHQQLFAVLDEVIEKYRVREASNFPVPGFPYLRTDRFLWTMGDRIDGDTHQEWIEAMRQLDLKARQKEIGNLSQDGLQELEKRLQESLDRRQLLVRVSHASEQLLAHDRTQPDYLAAVKASVGVAGEYVTAMRIFGLYPVAAIPVTSATKKQYDVFRQWHEGSLGQLNTDGNLTVFTPGGSEAASRGNLRSLFAPSRRSALGVPNLSLEETKALIAAYAPVIEQDVAGIYDLFGKVMWRNGRVKIESGTPTVYYYISHSLLKGEPVLQINYAFWYSGRYGKNSPGIERGPLDGVTFRITFDSEGDPIMADIMNNCGCYYFYVPRKERIAKINSSSDGLYPFVPAWLPDAFPDSRLSLRINSGWHQIQKVFARKLPSDVIHYELRPYDELEMLPRPGEGTESVFTSDGIMKDSSRIEPYIFFSMGIPKVGYMRQRGHHAIKLVGRGHFTDTDIYDRYFVFK
ncbi:MAG: hypothetical protein AMJ54_02780 [Deltaproteobacteria bacterium SG8_13]|nr:MAG: hypothetical protein AMJ54_02780 [Deltaproteobacteria bacterium SG8_13]